MMRGGERRKQQHGVKNNREVRNALSLGQENKAFSKSELNQ